jgi:hypothetical protein
MKATQLESLQSCIWVDCSYKYEIVLDLDNAKLETLQCCICLKRTRNATTVLPPSGKEPQQKRRSVISDLSFNALATAWERVLVKSIDTNSIFRRVGKSSSLTMLSTDCDSSGPWPWPSSCSNETFSRAGSVSKAEHQTSHYASQNLPVRDQCFLLLFVIHGCNHNLTERLKIVNAFSNFVPNGIPVGVRIGE